MQDRRHPLLPQTAITGFRKQGRRQERGPKQALEVHRHPNGWMWVEFITIRWSLVVSLWDCGTVPLRPRLNTQKVSSRVASGLVLAIRSYCWRRFWLKATQVKNGTLGGRGQLFSHVTQGKSDRMEMQMMQTEIDYWGWVDHLLLSQICEWHTGWNQTCWDSYLTPYVKADFK